MEWKLDKEDLKAKEDIERILGEESSNVFIDKVGKLMDIYKHANWRGYIQGKKVGRQSILLKLREISNED